MDKYTNTKHRPHLSFLFNFSTKAALQHGHRTVALTQGQKTTEAAAASECLSCVPWRTSLLALLRRDYWMGRKGQWGSRQGPEMSWVILLITQHRLPSTERNSKCFSIFVNTIHSASSKFQRKILRIGASPRRQVEGSELVIWGNGGRETSRNMSIWAGQRQVILPGRCDSTNSLKQAQRGGILRSWPEHRHTWTETPALRYLFIADVLQCNPTQTPLYPRSSSFTSLSSSTCAQVLNSVSVPTIQKCCISCPCVLMLCEHECTIHASRLLLSTLCTCVSNHHPCYMWLQFLHSWHINSVFIDYTFTRIWVTFYLGLL